jgi:hypothetical protein
MPCQEGKNAYKVETKKILFFIFARLISKIPQETLKKSSSRVQDKILRKREKGFLAQKAELNLINQKSTNLQISNIMITSCFHERKFYQGGK